MPDKEILKRLYIRERKTQKEIAKIFGVATSTVGIWLRKLDIPTRRGREAQRACDPSFEVLYQLYIIEEKSIDQIRREVRSSEASISRLLDQYGIEKRPNTWKFAGWNRGQSLPLKQREYLSNIAKKRVGPKHPRYGVNLSGETKRKISNTLKGRFRREENPNWKDSNLQRWRTMWESRFEYKEWRTAVFERDNYTCQMCGKPSEGDIQAHHIHSIRDNRSIEMLCDVNNGITLCIPCHKSIKYREEEYIEGFEKIIRSHPQPIP